MSCARMLAALKTPDLTAMQHLVYVAIVGLSEGNSCRASIQTIADQISRGTQRATVYRAVEALAEKELIRVERVAYGVNRYHLMDPRVHASGFIYFLQSEPGSPIKIGFSAEPEDQRKALQTSHYSPLKILGLRPADRKVEARLHQKFSEHKVLGEWFADHPELRQEIERGEP